MAAENLGSRAWPVTSLTAKMKVTIQLDRPLGSHDPPFTTTDSVRGVVNLDLPHEDAVTRITIELSGMVPYS